MRLHRIPSCTGWLSIALFAVFAGALVPATGAQAGDAPATEVTKSELPAHKQTTLGLYATSAEAYAAWKADPDAVTILDVRTPEEFIFIGHAEMAWNIPAFLQSLDWDAEKGHFPMVPVPDFVANVMENFEPTDTIYATCRSGSRSAMAINMLAKAGFQNVYNITDGVEGGKVEDEDSPDFGHRTVDGWKNSDLPWTYKVDPERMVVPD